MIFNPPWAMIMTYSQAKVQSVPKIKWKQTDRRTDSGDSIVSLANAVGKDKPLSWTWQKSVHFSEKSCRFCRQEDNLQPSHDVSSSRRQHTVVLTLMSENNMVRGSIGRGCRWCVHGERRYVKDEAVIAHTDRLVVAKVRQRHRVGRTVTTEYLPHTSFS